MKTQCGNVIIFLPLRFSVKLILENFVLSKNGHNDCFRGYVFITKTKTGNFYGKKSILSISEAQKLLCWPFLRHWILKLVNFCNCSGLIFFQNHIFRASKIVKMVIFDTFYIAKINFTQNPSCRKIVKFPHCHCVNNFFSFL